MTFFKRSTWLWILVVTVALALFAPATLVATDNSDNDDAQWETLQKCFKQSQSDSSSSGSSFLDLFSDSRSIV